MNQPKKVTPAELLLAKIVLAFPELIWKNYRYVDVGWDHEVLILDEKYVFRFPNDKEYEALLKDEIKLLQKLSPQFNVLVPQYQYVAKNYEFAGYPMIQGEPLSVDNYKQLEKRDRASIAKAISEFLTTMHTTEGRVLDLVPPPDTKESQYWIKKGLSTDLVAVLSEPDYKLANKILNDVDELLAMDLPKVFIHGDMYPEHLIWNSSTKELGIIDFSDMLMNDPAFDFAELYEYGSDFVEAIYYLYSGPKDNTFLERAWTYQCWVGVLLMADHFVNHKTSFAVARETFDRTKIKPVPKLILSMFKR